MWKKEANVIFTYSEIFINEQNEILRTMNKQFVCGEVYIGNLPKKYTKMIDESQYPTLKIKYPDTKIVSKADRFRVRYTIPTTAPISLNT